MVNWILYVLTLKATLHICWGYCFAIFSSYHGPKDVIPLLVILNSLHTRSPSTTLYPIHLFSTHQVSDFPKSTNQVASICYLPIVPTTLRIKPRLLPSLQGPAWSDSLNLIYLLSSLAYYSSPCLLCDGRLIQCIHNSTQCLACGLISTETPKVKINKWIILMHVNGFVVQYFFKKYG